MGNSENILNKIIRVGETINHQQIFDFFGVTKSKVKIYPLNPILDLTEPFYFRIYDKPRVRKPQIEKVFSNIITYTGLSWEEIDEYIMSKVK